MSDPIKIDESVTSDEDIIAAVSRTPAGATLLISRALLHRCRKIKGNRGYYIWCPGKDGGCDTILGRPYTLSDPPITSQMTKMRASEFRDILTEALVEKRVIRPGDRVDRVFYELFADEDCVGVLTRLPVCDKPQAIVEAK